MRQTLVTLITITFLTFASLSIPAQGGGEPSHDTLSKKEPAGDFYHTVTFQLKPGMSQEFLEIMKVALVDTRNFAGCKYVAMLVDNDEPDKVFFYEVWDMEENYKKYLAWRAETKFRDKMGHLLAGPPAASSYTLVQD